MRRRGGRRAAPLVLAVLVLAGCAAADPGPAVPVTELVARLPAEAAGLRRGQTLPLPGPGEGGREVAYASRGRVGPGATVEILGPGEGVVPEGPNAAAFEDLLQDALRPLPHRRMRERDRFTVPASGPPALRCAETEGNHGRERVEGLLCAGGFGGKLVRLRLAAPEQAVAAGGEAEPRSFAAAIAGALRDGDAAASGGRR